MFLTLANRERSEIEDIVLIDMSIKCEEKEAFLHSLGQLPIDCVLNPVFNNVLIFFFHFPPICSQLSFTQLQALSMATKIDTFQLQLSIWK